MHDRNRNLPLCSQLPVRAAKRNPAAIGKTLRKVMSVHAKNNIQDFTHIEYEILLLLFPFCLSEPGFRISNPIDYLVRQVAFPVAVTNSSTTTSTTTALHHSNCKL